MYTKTAHIYGFRCFGKAVFDLQYPGKAGPDISRINNVNLILGDNGRGKSSVLRAIAIAVLAPALMETGFVAYRLVRRPDAENAFLKVDATLGAHEKTGPEPGGDTITLIARIDRVEGRDEVDRLHLESTPQSPLEKLIYSDSSDAFFVAGYGATRRVESLDYSPSSMRKQRGARYARVASLFEDHIALRPLEVLLRDLDRMGRLEEGLEIINRVIPPEVEIGAIAGASPEAASVAFNGIETPFAALSDGYKAFVGMVGDLVGHLADVCPAGLRLDQVSGIVLIDEVDLHLHPSWQRRVVNDLSTAFPGLQFIMTSHSPLVVSAVESQNIFMTDLGEDGHATIRQSEEHAYGRTMDQLLLSSYFGLESARPVSAVQETEALLKRATQGDDAAVLQFLDRLGDPKSYRKPEGLSRVSRTLKGEGEV
eukprot:TRINITY_DN10574_c0_g1_i1.p2 TRINITY_DN10574_c0_g1~~TRINITY_DN10574_c0_g1_i1.p2  ORF type:complete len:425 (-),score=66.83 TRINITY_DN10574_c0_g1_i1:1244-2518(-)